MADPSYFDAQMQEHGAEPAHQFTGPTTLRDPKVMAQLAQKIAAAQAQED